MFTKGEMVLIRKGFKPPIYSEPVNKKRHQITTDAMLTISSVKVIVKSDPDQIRLTFDGHEGEYLSAFFNHVPF